jgi:hypothetical protein
MFPESLKYKVQKLAVSKNTYKLIPSKSSAITESDIVTITLPTNSICDFDSMVAKMKVKLDNGTGNTSTNYLAIPRWGTIFNKIVVSVGGQSLHSCNYLDIISVIKNELETTADEKLRKVPFSKGGPVAEPTAIHAEEYLVLKDFHGFLSSVKPRLLDLGLLPSPIQVHFHISNAKNLIADVRTTTSGKITLNDFSVEIDTYSIDNPKYYQLYDNFLSSAGNTLNASFKQYYTSLQAVTDNNQATRFSINTNSLDRLYGTFLTAQYNTLSTSNAVSHNSKYYDRDLSDLSSWALNLNNIQFPVFSADSVDAYSLYDNVNKGTGVSSECVSKTTWETPFGVCVYDFTLPNKDSADKDDVWVTGVNTLNTNASVSFVTSGTNTGVAQAMIIAETSSILKIGDQRQLEIIS